jgi:hypothetical protein
MIYVPAPDGGTPGPSVVSPPSTFKQNVLNGVTFPKFGISGFNNIMNGVTVQTLPSVSGVSIDSLKQNVTVPAVPAAATPATPKDDSSMNWLWILIIIPIGIAGAAAMSKSK